MARPERFELPTLWFEARCSDPLSYGRVEAIIPLARVWANGLLNFGGVLVGPSRDACFWQFTTQ